MKKMKKKFMTAKIEGERLRRKLENFGLEEVGC